MTSPTPPTAQAQEQKHTPTPWHILPNRNQPDQVQISAFPDCGPVLLAMAHHPLGQHEANATFIVEAVNNHERLLAESASVAELRAALEELLHGYMDYCKRFDLYPQKCAENARSALANRRKV